MTCDGSPGKPGNVTVGGERLGWWGTTCPGCERCAKVPCGCKPDGLDYRSAHEDAMIRMRRGERQMRCKGCGLWRWPHELGEP